MMNSYDLGDPLNFPLRAAMRLTFIVLSEINKLLHELGTDFYVPIRKNSMTSNFSFCIIIKTKIHHSLYFQAKFLFLSMLACYYSNKGSCFVVFCLSCFVLSKVCLFHDTTAINHHRAFLFLETTGIWCL